jgi:hypothetical protein
MIVTATWIALLVACVALELAAHRPGSRIATLRQLGAKLAARVPGRALLWAVWVFIGVHLFTRYTIPR